MAKKPSHIEETSRKKKLSRRTYGILFFIKCARFVGLKLPVSQSLLDQKYNW